MNLINAALGRIVVDTLITNVRVANVLTGEIYPADIAIHQGKIVALEPPNLQPPRQASRVIDGKGMIATPGLVDSHLHIESTVITPAHFAEAVLPLGTTTVLEDPHEIANVLGAAGIRAFLAASENIRLKVEFLVSSSVPSALGLETAGGAIEPDDVRALLKHPRVRGLAEVMDGTGLMDGDRRLFDILAAAGGGYGYMAGAQSYGVIEGHNPMLRGRALCAFVAAGVDSDHTQASAADLVEKARQGVTIMLQERYITREVIAALESLPFDIGTCIITDDVAPEYLLDHGHLDHVMRQCIRLGMSPMRALRACTLNPARRMRLWDRGLIKPGCAADIVLTESLDDFCAKLVLVDGVIVAENGRMMPNAIAPAAIAQANEALGAFAKTVHLAPQQASDFAILLPNEVENSATVEIRVIDCGPSTQTRLGYASVPLRDGVLQLSDDMAFICVVDRHEQHGGRAFGVVRGLGLRRGAFASSVAHDSHNLCVIGHSPAEMALAANAVIASDGGIAVVDGAQVLAHMALPIAGLLSGQPIAETAAESRAVYAAFNQLGLVHSHWLMRISTFTLPVSSGLRITDLGLVDANAREIVPLVVSSQII